eukprot:894403_1
MKDNSHNKNTKKGATVFDEKTEEDYVPNGATNATTTTKTEEGETSTTKKEDEATKTPKKEEEKKLSVEQIEILKQASIETICKMANLMRPDVRNQKLGVKFSRLQSMFYDKQFRTHCIETLADQIYEQNTIAGDAWKEAVQQVWNQKDKKNRFVDKKQLANRPHLCKMGCKRLTNQSTNPASGHSYDTCCGNCGRNVENKKDLVHESYCEKRHYNDWRCQIRDEALKTYLNAHPLKSNEETKKTEGEPQPQEEKKGEDTPRILVATPSKVEMTRYIADELSYHDSTDLVLAMRTRIIDVKSLRDELKNKTHGDIVSILLKLERMFKFKTMCSLNKKNIKKLNFANKKPTKAMPEWWSDTWDHCMVEGTRKYGWGNIPAQFARESYGFTPTYKGVKKVKKAKKNSKQQQAEAKQLKAINNGIQNVQIGAVTASDTTNTTTNTSATATPAPESPPVLIVKKRQCVAEDKKQETILISICNHFRKEIREKYKKLMTKIKNVNKLREQRVYNPSLSTASGSLNGEMMDMLKQRPQQEVTSMSQRDMGMQDGDRANNVKGKGIDLYGIMFALCCICVCMRCMTVSLLFIFVMFLCNFRVQTQAETIRSLQSKQANVHYNREVC